MREFDIERLCRLNGKSPTMRERWTAFHRLYRIATRGASGHQYQDALDALTIIDGFWPWVSLMESSGDRLRLPVPAFLRKMLLKSEKRRRMYGEHPEWEDRDKLVANHVRNTQGIEVTPEEVNETRRKVLRLARDEAVKCGVTLPTDDNAVLEFIKPR